jgi:hypothetical protein
MPAHIGDALCGLVGVGAPSRGSPPPNTRAPVRGGHAGGGLAGRVGGGASKGHGKKIFT